MKNKGIHAIWICLLVITNSIAQQVSFTAKADANKMVTGSTVNVIFTLNNAEGKAFKPPVINGLEIVGGPSTQNRMSIVNGKSTSSVSYTYTLLAEKTGRFTIGPATIDVKGKRLKSNAVNIQVLKGKAANQIEFKNNFVKIEVSDSSAVIGQQIILEYVLYFQQDLSGYDIEGEDFKYEGFFSQNINSKDRSTRRTLIDGQEYYVKTLESVTLFPQRTGVFEIEDVVVTLAVPIPGQRRRGFFSSAPTRNKQVRTNSPKIHVKDLPTPQPEYFSGAVGSYKMQAVIPKKSISTDDAILMLMEIRGNGDGKTVRAPVQPPMPHMEYYDPNIIDDKDINEVGSIDNYKKIEYLIVPKKAGNYIIKPEFTYYDTDSNDYITLKSNPVRVNVKQGSRTITTDDRDVTSGRKLSPSKQSTDIKSDYSLKYWDSSLYGGLGMFGLALLGLFWTKRQIDIDNNIDPIEKRKRAALALATTQLSEAKTHMTNNDFKEFYGEVSAAMNGFLGDKFQIPHKDFSKDEITRHLETNGVEQTFIDRYLEILKLCEMAIFAGQSASNMTHVYENSLSLIKDLATIKE